MVDIYGDQVIPFPLTPRSQTLNVYVGPRGPQGPEGPVGSGDTSPRDEDIATLIGVDGSDSALAVIARITTAINALIAGAPGALDTLDELSAALGDDANYAATITTALAGKQPLDSDLTAIAALTTTSFGRAFLVLADAAAGRTALALGTAATHDTGDYQPVDSDLTAIAALTTTSIGRSLLAGADAAALRTILALGTAATHNHGDYDVAGAAAAAQAASQPLDSDLTAFAAKTAPAGAVVGTTDVQTLTNKTLTSPAIATPTGLVKGDVGLGNVDNTSNATERTAVATLTNKTLTSPVVNTPTGIVKGDVGLGNVDNTSDVTKNAAAVTLTNKTLTSPVVNTPTGITADDLADGTTKKAFLATERTRLTALPDLDASGHFASSVMRQQEQQHISFRHTGALAETVPRHLGVSNMGTLTTSRLHTFRIRLLAGTPVAHITFLSGTTAGAGLIHSWFSLFDSAYANLKVTNDDTAATWAANTEKTLDIAGGTYTVSADADFFLGIVVSHSGGNTPSLAGVSVGAGVGLIAPIISGGGSGTYSTGPGSVPNPAPTPTNAYNGYAYAWVS